MGVKVIGSHVQTNKKLPATQAFCPEKWPAADRYNHLCKAYTHTLYIIQKAVEGMYSLKRI